MRLISHRSKLATQKSNVMDCADSGPRAVKLAAEFDQNALQADLAQIDHDLFGDQQTLTDNGVIRGASIDWKCLPLRSQGGSVKRTDPGGPGIDDYAFTEIMTQGRYLRIVLERIPAPLRSVRLMALGPGASVPKHRDTPTGFLVGMLRLHIPITTNPDAVLVIDGQEFHWQ